MSWQPPQQAPSGDWRGSYRQAYDRAPPPPRRPTESARRLIFAYTGSQAVKRFVGIAFVGMGLLFSVIFCWGLPVDVAISIAGKRAEGTVVKAELQRNVEVNDRHPTLITFRYRIGSAWHEGASSTLNGAVIAQATAGATIPLEVYPDVAGWARVRGSTYCTFGYLGLFTAIFPVVGMGLVFFAVRSNQREVRAFRRGLPATGLVIKKGEDTTTSVNDRHPFEVVWQFQVDGITYQGSLSNMDRALLERAVPGNEVTVLYDPRDPKVNTIWVD